MIETITKYEHIKIEEGKTPTITNTNMKVSMLVLLKLAYGWSAEELYFQYPFLTLGQIYAALAYYNDNQDEIEQEIDEKLETENLFFKNYKPSTLMLKLRKQKAGKWR